MEGTGETQDYCNRLHTVRLDPCELQYKVNIPRALRYMGQYDATLPEGLEARLEAIARDCEQSSSARAMARSFPLLRIEGEEALCLKGTDFKLEGTSICERLAGCETVTLLAVTLGMDNERALKKAQALSTLDGLIFDACSSSLVEEAANKANERIDELAHDAGIVTTKRFSPGYGDLPLDVQPIFLRTLGADKLLGIHVSSALLMTPMKSITAFIGLEPASDDVQGNPTTSERH